MRRLLAYIQQSFVIVEKNRQDGNIKQIMYYVADPTLDAVFIF